MLTAGTRTGWQRRLPPPAGRAPGTAASPRLWLPQPTHQRVLRTLGKDFWASTANLDLLSAGELRALFPPTAEVAIARHRTLGWTSNLLAHGRSL